LSAGNHPIFCEARQEGEAYGKTPSAHPFFVPLPSAYLHPAFFDPQRSPQY